MSEPRTRANALKKVVPGVYHWRILDERIGAESSAHAVATRGGLVLIDPLPLSSRAEAALARLGTVEAILLTGACHQRSAWRYREKYGAKVYAPRSAKGLDEKADKTYTKGDRLPGGLHAVHMPGPAEAHYGFLRRTGGGVFFCPDVLLQVGRGRLGFLPDPYQDDPAESRASAKKLLKLRFKTLCLAHGRPVTSFARRAIERALAADSKR